MDPYFRPVLFSTLFTLILNLLPPLPVASLHMLSYFIGGIIAVLLYRKELKTKTEIKTSDAALLGLGTGALVGAILSLIISVKLQDTGMQEIIIREVNERMKMHSRTEFKILEDLGPSFLVITSSLTIILCAIISFFGSLSVLPFVNRGKK